MMICIVIVIVNRDDVIFSSENIFTSDLPVVPRQKQEGREIGRKSGFLEWDILYMIAGKLELLRRNGGMMMMVMMLGVVKGRNVEKSHLADLDWLVGVDFIGKNGRDLLLTFFVIYMHA